MTAAIEKPGVPSWYWIVASLLLLWGFAGLFAFYSQLTTPYEQMIAKAGKAAADCIKDMPTALWWIYAIAVGSGTLGSMSLLLRRRWAQLLYLISLFAVIVQFGHSFLIQKIHILMGWNAAIFPAFIILMAAFQFGFAASARKKGWLG
ncbi:MAG: hypothetical protein V4618_02235 [Pseudomonadota bacterium]